MLAFFFRQNYHLRVRYKWAAGCAVFKSTPPGREELNRHVGALINVSFKCPGYPNHAYKGAAFLSLQVFVTDRECGCHITKPVRRSAQISLPRTLNVFAFTVTHIVRVTATGAATTLPIPSLCMLPARRSSKQRRRAERNTRRNNPYRIQQGRTQRGFEGVHQIQLGVWGRCEPPSGFRGGAPEDFEINTFQRLRTPVSLSFLSQCCYTKIHAIFFIHSHLHHFQLNEVVPNHMLWHQKSQC